MKRLSERVREYIELKLEINQLYKDLNRAKVEINFNKKEEKNPTIAETDYYYIRSTFQLERAISEIKDKINAKKIRCIGFKIRNTDLHIEFWQTMMKSVFQVFLVFC